MVYNSTMPKQSLLKTNPYLKDPEKRKTLFITTVSSSTAIEGVHAAVKQAISLKKSAKPLVIPKDAKSGGSRR